MRFLFIDDDEHILRALGRLLQREGFELHFTHDPLIAPSLIDAHKIEVVVCDHMMPGTTGLKLLTSLRERHPGVVRVLASGSQDRDESNAAGCVQRFIDKPWFPESLRKDLHEIERAVLASRSKSGD